jgi:hypothetical protein
MGIEKYSAEQLVERAVRNPRTYREGGCYVWKAVAEIFKLGSTSAAELCEKYGVDPDEFLEEESR